MLTQIELPELDLVARGKVREIFGLGEYLLLVTTDRLSAFDVVFAEGIPGKGAALTRVSSFWFDYLAPHVPHHLVTANVDAILAYARTCGHDLSHYREALRGHRLVGYVPDLTMSPSLDYAEEFLPGWMAGFAVSSALGQVAAVRSGAGIGILHTFIARAHDDLVPVETIAPIRRAYWLVYHESMRPLRRIQAVTSFIQQAVERDRGLFA